MYYFWGNIYPMNTVLQRLKGTGVALITPFKKNKKVDEIALAKLVNHSIQCGVDYLVVLGTTAEAATLTTEEKEQVKEIISTTNNGKLPMVLGIGGNNTYEVSKQINNTELKDYDAVLSVSPYYNKPTQEGIYEHFRYIAEHTDKNIIIYNVPSRTGSNIDSRTTLRLAHDFKNIIGIKEASPSFTQALEIIGEKPKDFLFLSGDDEMAVSTTLAGGDGTISVMGQAIPEFSKMINLALDKNATEAYEIYYKILPLIKSIYREGNPSGIKALLEVKEICNRFTRLPLVDASPKLTETIRLKSIFG